MTILEMPSPVGSLTLVADGDALVALKMGAQAIPAGSRGASKVLDRARRQLEEYFAGNRTEFDIPLSLKGTDFQRTVWNALLTIPFGETRSYGELARAVGSPKGSRAVGAANGQNPVGILVPCHRVIGADGSLTGYAGGVPRKRWLLDWERGPSLI